MATASPCARVYLLGGAVWTCTSSSATFPGRFGAADIHSTPIVDSCHPHLAFVPRTRNFPDQFLRPLNLSRGRMIVERHSDQFRVHPNVVRYFDQTIPILDTFCGVLQNTKAILRLKATFNDYGCPSSIPYKEAASTHRRALWLGNATRDAIVKNWAKASFLIALCEFFEDSDWFEEASKAGIAIEWLDQVRQSWIAKPHVLVARVGAAVYADSGVWIKNLLPIYARDDIPIWVCWGWATEWHDETSILPGRPTREEVAAATDMTPIPWSLVRARARLPDADPRYQAFRPTIAPNYGSLIERLRNSNLKMQDAFVSGISTYQKREETARLGHQPSRTSGTKVYKWEWSGATRARQRLKPDDVVQFWGDYASNQRIYNAYHDEYDLCSDFGEPDQEDAGPYKTLGQRLSSLSTQNRLERWMREAFQAHLDSTETNFGLPNLDAVVPALDIPLPLTAPTPIRSHTPPTLMGEFTLVQPSISEDFDTSFTYTSPEDSAWTIDRRPRTPGFDSYDKSPRLRTPEVDCVSPGGPSTETTAHVSLGPLQCLLDQESPALLRRHWIDFTVGLDDMMSDRYGFRPSGEVAFPHRRIENLEKEWNFTLILLNHNQSHWMNGDNVQSQANVVNFVLTLADHSPGDSAIGNKKDKANATRRKDWKDAAGPSTPYTRNGKQVASTVNTIKKPASYPPVNLWDLHPDFICHYQSPLEFATMFSVLPFSANGETYYLLDNRNSPRISNSWVIVFSHAVSVMEIVRRSIRLPNYDWDAMVRDIVQRGVPFSSRVFTYWPLDPSIENKMTFARNSLPFGTRTGDYVFSRTDVHTWKSGLRNISTLPNLRAAWEKGGVLRRIVMTVLSPEEVLQGPSPFATHYGYGHSIPFHGGRLVADELSQREEDMIIGLFRVRTRKFTPYQNAISH